MVDVARQCAQLHAQGRERYLSPRAPSRPAASAWASLNLPLTVTTKQMLAAVGQSRLMMIYESFFEIYGIHVGQVLLTRADVKDRGRFLNARDTLQALLEHRSYQLSTRTTPWLQPRSGSATTTTSRPWLRCWPMPTCCCC